MNKFKAIVFDFGGVIELSGGNIMEEIANILSVSFEDFQNTYHQYNHLSNVHNMKWEDVAVETARVFNTNKDIEDQIRKSVRAHKDKKIINSILLDIFPMLREKGYKIAILSNNTTDLRERLKEKGILSLVDEVFISAEIGHQKPHKEAFDVAFKKLGVHPKEVIFVDDSPKSLEKASEIGYQPVLFKNNEQFKADLLKLGIQI